MKNSISGTRFESSFAYREHNWRCFGCAFKLKKGIDLVCKLSRSLIYYYYYVLERDYGQILQSEWFQIDFLDLVRWAVGVLITPRTKY
jgi:hypothetical protein